MKLAQVFERLAGSLAIVACGLVVSANEGCLQKDVEFAPNSNLQSTGTPAPTDDGGGDTTTPTPGGGTPTAVPTVSATEDPDPTDAPDPDPEAALSEDTGSESEASEGSGLLLELSKLSNGGSSGSQRSASGSNWLGQAFGGGDGEGSEKGRDCLDSDGDGFLDHAEVTAGTATDSPGSTPPQPTTKIADRLRGVDTDMDGLGDSEDSDPSNPDSDRDGRLDGSEMLCGGNIQDPNDTYPDDDGDGLSNDFEDRRGTNSALKDTDGDGLNDAMEFAIGSNAHVCDTDGDGVLDGAEVNIFSSDPTRGEKNGKR